jgi:hypothetical protein
MNLPHCPRCGGAPNPPVQFGTHSTQFYAPWCPACGLDEEAERGFGTADSACVHWTRVVRAELARQALEARAIFSGDSAKERIAYVLREYEELGANPIRLPGEDAHG